MMYLVFMALLALECCPVEGWDWDFGFWWVIVAFLLVVQVACDVTRAMAQREREEAGAPPARTPLPATKSVEEWARENGLEE